MRILIWGGDSWANRGDAAVLAGTLASIRETIPEAVVAVASDRPAVTARQHNVQAVRRRSLAFLFALVRADVVLWGGGQLVQNASSKPFLFLQLSFLAAALLLRKKVVCYGQGVGPVSGALSRLCTRLALDRLSAVSVRDHASARRLAALGVEHPYLRVAADPSFCLPPASDVETEAFLRLLGVRKPFVVIAVRRWGHYRGGWLPVRWSRRKLSEAHERWFQDFPQHIASVADYLCDQMGTEVLFVPMCPGGDQEDDRVAGLIRDQMGHRAKAHILGEEVSSPLLKGLLGQAELVLAMRTHAGMLAADAGVPLVSISYQGKGEGFMEEVGLARYVLPVESVDRDNLLELVRLVWRDRDAIRSRLAARAPELRRRAQENSVLVKGVFGEGRDSGLRKSEDSASGEAERWSRLTRGDGRAADALAPGRLSALLRRRRALCLELAAPGPGDVVLDVGCGVGHYREPVTAAGATWVGVDRSRPMLFHARNSAGEAAALVQGDLLQLPWRDTTASVCLCAGVLDYLPPETVAPALRELARILEPGGRLVITCNGAWWAGGLRAYFPFLALSGASKQGRRYDHVRRLPGLLAEAGLECAAEERLAGGFLGPDTVVFLCRKESQRCVSAATTGRSSHRI